MNEPARVAFHRSLYLPEAVQSAMAAYSPFAKLELSEAGSDLVVTVSEIDPEADEDLIDAFCNHVLFETVVQSRGAAL